MKKQKQPVDRDLVDRSLFARIEPFLYLLPFLIGIAVFTLYPVINVVLMSFKEGYSYLSRGTLHRTFNYRSHKIRLKEM